MKNDENVQPRKKRHYDPKIVKGKNQLINILLAEPIGFAFEWPLTVDKDRDQKDRLRIQRYAKYRGVNLSSKRVVTNGVESIIFRKIA